jgi:hypothetical protein
MCGFERAATSTADHLFLRPGENRLDKHPQTPGRQLMAAKVPLITSWPKDGYSTVNKRSTDDHGPRDIGPVVPTA